ncbi:Coiled-coil domain-containing protein 12 [Vanrija pseudolonga]|uniref:Coiled-coil domain-containing protein 12 n=1 Tax=Vanrija pseudolonga TaxID=143232 RepID=A0AAF0Y259_9TREE|nr:Coiled-coil domain-containing protein 12 [Vanrija pseudolonga]
METNLAVTAAARKERLIALRKRKDAHDAGESDAAHFTFKQRNFDPETRQMRAREGAGEDTVEKAVEGLAEEIVKEDEARRAEELDLFNIQPKRPNWDLKRDMNACMGKLERKTNESIATIFRQRLQGMRKEAAAGEIDILASINAAEHENNAPEQGESDDE